MEDIFLQAPTDAFTWASRGGTGYWNRSFLFRHQSDAPLCALARAKCDPCATQTTALKPLHSVFNWDWALRAADICDGCQSVPLKPRMQVSKPT